jgi:hypothetical protein
MAYFRTAIKAISPGPFRDGTSERYMYTFGLIFDALMQKMVEGQLARMPMKCAPAFLSIIGSDRLINQGLTESTDSYRVRLRKAFETWRIAGSARSVLVQALGYLLSSTPMARMVSSRFTGNVADLLFVTAATNATPIRITTKRAHGLTTGDSAQVRAVAGNTAANGTWTVTVDATNPAYSFTLDTSVGSGAYSSGGYVVPPGFPTVYPPTLTSSNWDTYAAGADTSQPPQHLYRPPIVGPLGYWDWDSVTPWAGCWIWQNAYFIVYSVAPNTHFTPAPAWGSGVTWGDDMAWGVSQSSKVGRSLQIIVGQWKAAQTCVRWIIVSFDATLFDPDQPVGGGINPDGRFGRWSKLSGGQYVASRFSSARYGDGVI